jgi:hypothetical protein
MSTTLRTRKARAAHADAVEAKAYANFTILMKDCRIGHIKAACKWYGEAHMFARSLMAIRPEWDMEVAASVVSAFSPRVTWAHNKVKALQYAQGITPKGLRSHVAAADRVCRMGFMGLGGLKTNAFARAIAGDEYAVVVDVWMCRAAGLSKDAPNVTEYRAIERAIREFAHAHSTPPATMQALLWILARGNEN